MRTRPLIALSVAAAAALLLAGCSSAPAPVTSPTATAAADLCSAAVSSGTASDAVKVSGEVGKAATVSFSKPLTVKSIQSTVVTKGDGQKLKAGDLVDFALTQYNAKTGEKLGAAGQKGSEILPQAISPDSILGKVLGCADVGTRVVATIPGDSSNPATINVIDLVGITAASAQGSAVTPKSGFPTVKTAADGTPSVTLPKDAAMPTAFEKETLKKGDGDVVKANDGVLVQYYGYSWNKKKEFDKSWGAQPMAFTVGQGVVSGFSKAVEGETVGSQVLAVLPPADAYGKGKINDKDLTGQTLVFVVDILAIQPAAPAAK